jgi:mRNA interferase RelE/StbE
MAAYEIVITSRARRSIRRLGSQEQRAVASVIDALADEPRPRGTTKMKGYDRRYRVRIGDYRVVYEIYDDRLIVEVIEAGHRREIYR